MTAPVILRCAMPECPELIAPDPKHLENLIARGGWLCHRHDSAHTPQKAETR